MTRLRPETAVNVVFEGGFSPGSVPGRIVRSVVAQIDSSGKLWFDLGITFRKAIAFDHVPGPVEAPVAAPAPQAAPVVTVPLVNRW
jgi:hypothetical protein